MIKKFSIVIMYIVFLLSFLACNKYDTYQNNKKDCQAHHIDNLPPYLFSLNLAAVIVLVSQHPLFWLLVSFCSLWGVYT